MEDLAASALMTLGSVSGVVFGYGVFEYGAFEVQDHGVELADGLSLLATGGLLPVTSALMYRAYREEKAGPRTFPRYAAALILAFMLGSKVLSPQYVIWLLLLVPLRAGGVSGLSLSAVFLAFCYLTAQVLPVHYENLLNLRSPGPALLLACNLLFVLLWGLLLPFLPRHAPEKTAA